MRTAALIPTIYRPDGLRIALQSLRNTASDVVPVVACEQDDTEAPKIAEEFGAVLAVCEQYRAGCAYGWNTALRAAQDFELYVIASDDVEFLDGWLENAMIALQKMDNSGLVGLRGNEAQELSDFYMMSRDFIIKSHGGVAAVPHYEVWGVDTEACMRARRARKYTVTKKQCVTHHRKLYQPKLPPFDVRQKTNWIYSTRERQGFPNDFEAILCE